MKEGVKKLLRSRLLHFGVLGAVLFAFAPASVSARRVSVPTSYLRSLRAAQAQKLGVETLSDQVKDEVDRRAVEDEVLYREALRLGLDRDDSVVRQHLIQKVLVLAEDLAGASREPTPDEVRAYYESHAAAFRRGRELHFIHVFGAARETLLALAETVRAEEASRPGVPPPVGDAFPRSRDVVATADDVAVTFGAAFAEAVVERPVGSWTEPLPSRFGWHLVKIVERTEGRTETFAEAEGRARMDLSVERRHAAIAGFIARAMQRYEVDVDGSKVKPSGPTARLAMRASPSGED